ncbi:MAG: M23 family metallopeptidase [Firmicutes bacterium]|nr:M23 family metallopeptidase [Bacillota bacterium]
MGRRLLVVVFACVAFAAGAAAGLGIHGCRTPPAPLPATTPLDGGRQEPAGEAATVSRPVLVVSAKPSSVPQGGLLSVIVEGAPEGAPVTVELFGRAVAAFSSGETARVFVPVAVTQAPGVFEVDAHCGECVVVPAFVEVTRREFPSSHIAVTQETAELTRNQARIAADQAKVRSARATTSPRPYGEGSFSLPLEAEVTTPFGHTRYVNGVESGRHWGIDFGAAAGRPVKAANAGKVVLAETLLLSGNTVIVDHGLNVFTTYMHLADISVKPGDVIEKGTTVGHVGSTGFSTGPHLHWSATCGGESFDPSALLELDW